MECYGVISAGTVRADSQNTKLEKKRIAVLQNFSAIVRSHRSGAGGQLFSFAGHIALLFLSHGPHLSQKSSIQAKKMTSSSLNIDGHRRKAIKRYLSSLKKTDY